MKGSWITYTPAQLRWIEAHRTEPRAQAHAAFCKEFGRDDVSLTNFHALCKRKGWLTGRTGRLEPGNTPHNKGKPCPPGVGGNSPNARKTQFTAGARRGRAAENYKPIGSERLSKDGYLERKIHDGMPLQSRWRAVHLVRWEEINGSLPSGMCLKNLDGDRSNTDPSNWEAIPRGVAVHLSGRHATQYDSAAPELRPAILTLAKLKHARRRIASPKQTTSPTQTLD